jgi:MSHA biogenesis protein MshG
MARFVIQWASPSGKTSTATVEAATERAAVALIESRGDTPISIRPVDSGSDPARGRGDKTAPKRPILAFSRRRGLRRALLDFTHQLAAVAESGIPIIAGLKAVAEQTRHPDLRAAVWRVAGRIDGGRSLADALAGEDELFPPIYVKTVAAGEAAGQVPEVLRSLAGYQEQEAETRSRIKSALLYPSLVVVSLILATVFMLVFVIPQFADMFSKFDGQLPLPTRIVLAVSEAITQHYLIVVCGVACAVYGLKYLFGLAGPRAWLDDHVLRVPVFGQLMVGVYMVRLIELLNLLMAAALPITQSLRVTADSMTNKSVRDDVYGMLRSVEGGRSLTEAFTQTRWLTPLVKQMLAIGEYAGRTDQIFAYLRRYYAEQTQRSVKMLSTLIEPAMVTCLAAVVLFFALSIWKLLKLVGTA